MAVVEVEKEKWKRRLEKLEQKVETPRHLKHSRNPANWKHQWQGFCVFMNANGPSGKENTPKVAIFILILMDWTH